MYEIEEPLTQLGLLGGGLHAGAFHPAVVHFTWPCCCEFFGGGVGGVRGASPRCDFVLILLAARPPSFARTQVRAREGGALSGRVGRKSHLVRKTGASLDPDWHQSGSILVPVWIQTGASLGPTGASLDPDLHQFGSRLVPVWIQTAASLDPDCCKSGSRLLPV